MFIQFIKQAKMIYVQDINQAKRKEALLDEAYKHAKKTDEFAELHQQYKKLSADVKRIYANQFFSIEQKIMSKAADCLDKSYSAPKLKFF